MPGTASQLTTDWICIATEGPTVDGRNIPPQWLTEMVETYDPVNVYNAQIWPEHDRWWGAYGEVQELKTEMLDGVTKLYGRICPSVELIQMNKNGQLLFASIEPDPSAKYAGGKCYLSGLGVTNSPASVGTERMRFGAERAGKICGELMPFHMNLVSEDKEENDMPGEKKKFNWKSLFTQEQKHNPPEPNTPAPPTPEPDNSQVTPPNPVSVPAVQTPPESDPSKPTPQYSAEEVAALNGRLDALETQFQEMSDGMGETFAQIKELLDSLGEQFNAPGVKDFIASIPDMKTAFAELEKVVTKTPSLTPGGNEKKKLNLV